VTTRSSAASTADLFDGGDGNDVAVDPFNDEDDTLVSIEHSRGDVPP
jgi:hypothetical protein